MGFLTLLQFALILWADHIEYVAETGLSIRSDGSFTRICSGADNKIYYSEQSLGIS